MGRARLKRLLGNTLFSMRAATGSFRLNRMLPRGSDVVSILMYHGLETAPARLEASEMNVAPDACAREIRFHLAQGYRLIPPQRLSEIRRHGFDGHSRALLLISFDDGHLNTFHYLNDWMTRERLPVLLAVCPGMLDDPGVYWYEEIQARLALMDERHVELDVRGRVERYGRNDWNRAVRRCCELPRAEARDFLEQLRQETSGVSGERIRQSPFVHQNMGWDEVKQLVATGCCTVAAHSWSHERATSLSPAEFAEDAKRCKRRLEQELGIECVDYVYPFGSPGDFSEQTDAIAAECGFRRTYTTVHRLNRAGETMPLGRFRGTGFGGSLTYYAYLWRSRHATIEAKSE